MEKSSQEERYWGKEEYKQKVGLYWGKEEYTQNSAFVKGNILSQEQKSEQEEEVRLLEEELQKKVQEELRKLEEEVTVESTAEAITYQKRRQNPA